MENDSSEVKAGLLVVTGWTPVVVLREEVTLAEADEVEDEADAAEGETGAAGLLAKMSSCAPGLNPLRALYAGVCPPFGNTLLPVNWFHTIICFAPVTHFEVSSSH
jgi:hypothetical protein